MAYFLYKNILSFKGYLSYMITDENKAIIDEYLGYLKTREFPCIAAKAALARQQVKCMVAGNMSCPKDDILILKFLYDFVDDYRNSKEFYHSASVIFTGPVTIDEDLFDKLLWNRLQALADLDAVNYAFDKRVNKSPSSPKFSFSIKEEAFYIVGLHPNSSRQARKFRYPTLVFNPHAQFEVLKETHKYESMKNVVRKRDIAFSGSINPMLKDFGISSEVYQYSGLAYDERWQCPLKINHGITENNSTA